MRINQTGLLILSMAALLMASCSSGKFPGFEEGDNGVFYKVHYRGDQSASPSDSGWVMVNMNYRLADTLLFSSQVLDEDMIFPMIEPNFEGDLYDGLRMMNEGDSMTFAIVADSFFIMTAKMRQLPDYVEAGAPMYYDVKLLKRFTDDEYRARLDQEKAVDRRKEIDKLKAYLEKNDITAKPLPSGLIFIPLEKGHGKRPDTGEMCRVYLKVEVLDGDLLYSNFDGEPLDIEYGKSFDTEGLMEGIGLMKTGGKARLIVPSPIGVGEYGKETVEPFTTLVYEVELNEITSVDKVKKERARKKKAAEAELTRLKEIEPNRIEKYLSNNTIQAQPTASGLYVIELITGNGDKPVAGDVVKIHYALFSIEGKKLESSYDQDQPIEVTLGNNLVIKGWEEGIPHIREGGKSRLIVPSALAYGNRQKGDITPYSPLIFDVEVIEIVNR